MYEIEQPAGPPLVCPVDPEQTDKHRREVYLSYERYLRKRLMELDSRRQHTRDYSDMDAYLKSIEPLRKQFKEMLGFWVEPEERPNIRIVDEYPLLETDSFAVGRLTYEVLPDLITYAVRIVPKSPGPHPGLLVQHGYTGTPEMACGLTETANSGEASYRSMGLRAAERGYHVLAPHHPSGYGTTGDAIDSPLPDHPEQSVHYGKNRLHRLCLLGGGTLIGLDMLVSSRAIDLLVQDPDVDTGRIGMYGLSRGGQSALYLPAMDRRIRASVASAYFNTRLQKLVGPYSRTNYVDWFAEGQILPGQVRDFSDADIASLIAPRGFAVESGIKDTAVDQDAARSEFLLVKEHYRKLGVPERCDFIPHQEGHVSATRRAFEFLSAQLTRDRDIPYSLPH